MIKIGNQYSQVERWFSGFQQFGIEYLESFSVHLRRTCCCKVQCPLLVASSRILKSSIWALYCRILSSELQPILLCPLLYFYELLRGDSCSVGTLHILLSSTLAEFWYISIIECRDWPMHIRHKLIKARGGPKAILCMASREI